MAQLALNVFKTKTLEVTTSEQTVYTAPVGYTSIILYSHVSNVGSSSATFTISHYRSSSSTQTEIIKDGTVPINDAYVPLQGRLVLETNDAIRIEGSDNNTLKVILSILETANQ